MRKALHWPLQAVLTKQQFMCEGNSQQVQKSRTGNPQDVTEHKHDLPKVKLWGALMKNKFPHPSFFFFLNNLRLTGDTFLDMLDNSESFHCGNSFPIN
jgi:hypothetical protein